MFSDVDFDLSLDTGDLSGLITICLIALAVIVVAAVVVARRSGTPRSAARRAGQGPPGTGGAAESPTKLLQLFGGNLVSQVLFGVAMAACVEAFGQNVSLSELVLINTVVSLFAGLLPIPGGIGVSEAGLTLGTHGRRTVVGDRLRRRPRLPVRQLLPAADLGILLLPMDDSPSLSLSSARLRVRRRAMAYGVPSHL